MTQQREKELHDVLDPEFQRLAKQPIGRGPEAGELWARAEVVRRLESQPALGPERSPSVVWGPLAGALAALVAVAGIWLSLGWNLPAADASEALVSTVGIVVGGLGVLGLAACSSLALVWHEL